MCKFCFGTFGFQQLCFCRPRLLSVHGVHLGLGLQTLSGFWVRFHEHPHWSLAFSSILWETPLSYLNIYTCCGNMKRVLHSCVYLNLLKYLAWITHYNPYHHSCIAVDYFCMVKLLKVHTYLRSMKKRTGCLQRWEKKYMKSIHKIVLCNVSVKVNSR